MKVDHVMAAVLVVLSTAYLAATLRVVDQISKSCPVSGSELSCIKL